MNDALASSQQQTRATILVVDDDEEVLRSIELGLRQNYLVLVANNPTLALQVARRDRPALIILDVLMPDMTGIELCRQFRLDPLLVDTPVLFLTARGSTADKIEGLQAGGDDYLTKPYNLQELKLRVQSILRRTGRLTPETKSTVLKVGELTLDTQAREAVTLQKRVLLTPVEYNLLYHLMAHAGEILSPERLLREVWNFPYDTGSPDLVRLHVKNLRGKIELDPSQPLLIRTVRNYGYTISAEPPAGA
ncbi:MAG: response regulator transcription factor [Chloroflexi bacterium]|nr:response regulator transcription factor [Chloroflexota bacterium]